MTFRCRPSYVPSGPRNRTVQQERAALALKVADHEVHGVVPRRLRERLDGRAGHFDAALLIAPELLPPCSDREPTTAPKSSPRGYPETNASGKSTSRAPFRAASPASSRTLASVACD